MSKMLFKEKEVDSRKKIMKILKNPEMGKVVNNIKEKKEVVAQFKRYSPGGITKDEARKILGKFRYDKRDSLNETETAGLAKALGITGVHKYKRPQESSSGYGVGSKEGRRGFSNNSGKSSSTGLKSGGYSKMSPLH